MALHKDRRYYRVYFGAEHPGVKGPGVVTKVFNFAKAATKHVATGMKKTSEATRLVRLQLCESCEVYFDREKRVCKHRKCGCNVGGKILDKTAWAEQSCPIGRWGPETTQGDGNADQHRL